MKMKRGCCFLLLLVCVFLSCTKKHHDVPTLVGKWKLTQVDDAFGGPDKEWQAVSEANAELIEFTADQRFTKTAGASGNNQVCTGSYQRLTPYAVEIQTHCENEPQQFIISAISAEVLILDGLGTEGRIRNQYKAIK